MNIKYMIPYGYRRVNGEIVIFPEESEVVKLIFREYIGGLSFRKLAKLLQEQGYIYCDESGKWSMGAIQKLMNRECYIGKNGYPRIVSDENFRTAQELSAARRKLPVKPSDICRFRKIAVCDVCGKRLERFGTGYKGVNTYYWRCKNSNCAGLGFGLTDSRLINAFDTAVSGNERIIPKKQNDESLDNKIRYQQNEINRKTDSDKADYDRIKEEIIKLASLKYENIDYQCSDKQSEMITEILNNYVPDAEMRYGFLEKCTKKIRIGSDGIMRIELIDGSVLISEIERKNQK